MDEETLKSGGRPRVGGWRPPTPSPRLLSRLALEVQVGRGPPSNFDSMLFTVHIRWGNSTAARQRELQLVADWIDAKRQEKHCEDRDIIVTGDFHCVVCTATETGQVRSRGREPRPAIFRPPHRRPGASRKLLPEIPAHTDGLG